MKIIITFLILLCAAETSFAQTATYQQLNNIRISTNKTGLITLGSWGAANLAGGITGYAIAGNAEWKSFHGMNAVWGAVNGLIAVGGYLGARKEATKEYDFDEAFRKYQSSKRVYLINAGLDVLYIGTGAALMHYASKTNKPQMWSGYGKSIAFQGIALLVFDCTMYGVHLQHNKKWHRALSGFTINSDGLGYTYHF